MSLSVINEIVGSCDAKKAAGEVCRYAQSISESGESMGPPDGSTVWGSAVKYLIQKSLILIETAKTEKEMRSLYSSPLRGLLTALHGNMKSESVHPPLHSTCIVMLYQHIAQVFKMNKINWCIVDYTSSLNLLLRIEKYGNWMQPELLEDLISATTSLLSKNSAKSLSSMDYNVSLSFGMLLVSYQRTLPSATVTKALSFCSTQLPKYLDDFTGHQGVVLNILKGLVGTLSNSKFDYISESITAVESLSVCLLRWISCGQSNEALRAEVVAVYSEYFEIYQFMGDRQTNNDVCGLADNDLWVALGQNLSLVCTKATSAPVMRRELVSGTGKMGALLELQAKVFLSLKTKKDHSLSKHKDPVEMLTSPLSRSDREVGQLHSTCYMMICSLVTDSLNYNQLMCVLKAICKALSSLTLGTLHHVAFQSCVKIIKAMATKGPLSSSDISVVDSLRSTSQLKLSSQPTGPGTKTSLGQCTSAAAELLIVIEESYPFKDGFENSLINLVLTSSLLDSPVSCCSSTGRLVAKMIQNTSTSNPNKERMIISKIASWLTESIAIGSRGELVDYHAIISQIMHSASTRKNDIEFGRVLVHKIAAKCNEVIHTSENQTGTIATLIWYLVGTLSVAVFLKKNGCEGANTSLKQDTSTTALSILEAVSRRLNSREDQIEVAVALQTLFEFEDSFLAQFGADPTLSTNDQPSLPTNSSRITNIIGGITRRMLAHLSEEPEQNLNDDFDMDNGFLSTTRKESNLTTTGRCDDANHYKAVAAAIRCYTILRKKTHDPDIGPDVRKYVESSFNSKHEKSFDVLSLVVQLDDEQSAVLCIKKVREMLSEKSFKQNDQCYQKTLSLMDSMLLHVDKMIDEELLELIHDTVDKLCEVSMRGHMSQKSKISLCRTIMRLLPKVEGEMCNLALLKGYLPLLTDESYAVRKEAASHSGDLVLLFSHSNEVFVTLLGKLSGCYRTTTTRHTFGSNTRAQTAILTITNMAKSCHAIQSRAVLELMLIYIQENFTEKYTVEQCLREIGGCAVDVLINRHVLFLFRGWILDHELSLRSIPYCLINPKYTYQSFCESYLERGILSTTLQVSSQQSRSQLIKSLCAITTRDETEMLVSNIASIFGQAYLNYYDEEFSCVAKAVCEDYTKGRLSDQRLAGILEKNALRILQTFISLETSLPESEIRLPYIHSSIVDRAFCDFSRLWSAETEGLLASSPDYSFSLLFSLALDVLDSTRLTAFRGDRFSVFQRVIKRCSPETVLLSYNFRLIIHTSLTFVEQLVLSGDGKTETTEIIKKCLNCLQDICVSATKKSPKVLTRFLSDIAARLVQFAPVTSPVSRISSKRKRQSVISKKLNKNNDVNSLSSAEVSDSDAEQDTTIETQEENITKDFLPTLLMILKMTADTKQCREILIGSVNPLPVTTNFRNCSVQYDRLVGVTATPISSYVESLHDHGSCNSKKKIAILKRLSSHNRNVNSDDYSQLRQLIPILSKIATEDSNSDVRMISIEALRVMIDTSMLDSDLDYDVMSGIPIPPPAFNSIMAQDSDVVLPVDSCFLSSEWIFNDLLCVGKIKIIRKLLNSMFDARLSPEIAGLSRDTLKIILNSCDLTICNSNGTAHTVFDQISHIITHCEGAVEGGKPFLDDLLPLSIFNNSQAIINVRQGVTAVEPNVHETPFLCSKTLIQEVDKCHSLTENSLLQEYDGLEWVRRFTCGFVKSNFGEDGKSFWSHMSAACLKIPGVSEICLPFLILEIEFSKAIHKDSTFSYLISECFNRIFHKNSTSKEQVVARCITQTVLLAQSVITEDLSRRGTSNAIPQQRNRVMLGGYCTDILPGTLVKNGFLYRLDIAGVVRGSLDSGVQPESALKIIEMMLLEDNSFAGLLPIRSESGLLEASPNQLDNILSGGSTSPVSHTPSQVNKHSGKIDEARSLASLVAQQLSDTEMMTVFKKETSIYATDSWSQIIVESESSFDVTRIVTVLRASGLHSLVNAIQGDVKSDQFASVAAKNLSQWDVVTGDQSFGTTIESCIDSLTSLRNDCSSAGIVSAHSAAIDSALLHIRDGVSQELYSSGREGLQRCLAKLSCCSLLKAGQEFLISGQGNLDVLLKNGESCSVPRPNSPALADLLMPHILLSKILDIVAPANDTTVSTASGYTPTPAVQSKIKVSDMLSGIGAYTAAGTFLKREACDEMPDKIPFVIAEARLLRKQAGCQQTAVTMLKQAACMLQRYIVKKSVVKDRKRLKSEKRASAAEQLYASVLCKLGKWMGVDKSETRNNVIDQYLTPAAQLVASVDCKERSQVFFALARFTDKLFITMSKAGGNSAASKLMQQARAKYDECHSYLKEHKGTLSSVKERDLVRTSYHFAILSNKASEEHERLGQEQSRYLLQSLKAYAMTLNYSTRYDIVSIFRLVSLWFSNPESPEINHYLTSYFGKHAQTYKFIPLSYQLVSRLTGNDTPFQSTLLVLLQRLSKHHPHHVIYHISGLAHGDVIPSGQRYKEVFKADAAKVQAAKSLLKSLQKSKTLHGPVSELHTVIKSYMLLAFLPVAKEDGDGRRVTIPDKVGIQLLRDMSHTIVTSVDVPVNAAADYSNAPKIKEFDSHFTTAGGINLPKIIRCLGTDGKWHKQLVKGGSDDLRQDFVLEQIFSLCNWLFSMKNKTHNKLNIRTYKVVPVSPSSGVVQWVNETIPMGEWLLCRANPRNGAHSKYTINNLSYRECRDLLMKEGMSVSEKQATFKHVCQNVTPVFHRFFLERFPSPKKWFDARMSYTLSTATAAMIGYIIGLGDRHSQNILIDNNTGEVIHIDLGIAFEKGKFLPVPELVPFRLTRDVVDGMGICGTEGCFRSSCEKTMTILKENKQLLQTVVEVFIHDPLYNYSLDPAKVIHKQQEFANKSKPRPDTTSPDGGNNDAELAVMRVVEKLDGYEDGEYLSVKGQVNDLIRTATSEDTLAMMYAGWAPWM